MFSQSIVSFPSNFRFVFKAFGARVPVLLASVMIMASLLDVAAADTFTPGQIFEKVRANYDSLSSYSDKGQVTATMDGDVTVTQFTIRLARTSCYRIEWQRYSAPSLSTENSPPSAVWCSGAGNYLEAGRGVQGPVDRQIALTSGAALSGGAAGTIPELFFSLQAELNELEWDEKRQPDEKLGDIDCYLLAAELPSGVTKTYWVGKQDFLIRQVRTVVSAKAMQAAWAEAIKESPEIAATLHGFTTTETHTNIVLNPQFSRSDFIPSFPLFQDGDDE